MTPDALVREAARAGFNSVGLRLHPAMAGGIAYPLAPMGEGIIREAREGRLPPGQGQLPLAGLLNVLPPQMHWSVEIPCPAICAPERLAQAFTITRAWLASTCS